MDYDSTAPTNPIYQDRIDDKSIRLLQFTQSQDGRFTGRLKKFALVDAPPFFVASYTWGQGTYASTAIEFKMGRLRVLDSLLPFLAMVSNHEEFDDSQYWWIDSICVNLTDGPEREQQVRIMADIYTRARRSIVWLGEEVEGESDCRGAIEFMHYLSKLQPAFSGTDAQITRLNLRASDLASEWTSISHLLGRPWWTRVWTLQEMILPRELKMFCGSSSISRGKFKAAMYSIFLCSVGNHDVAHEFIPRHIFDAAFNRRRIHQWHVNPKSRGIALVAILAYLGNHSASDSRDRIYSVLGITTTRDRRLIGNPEYTSSVAHIYAKLVRSFYIEYRNLDIICFSHIFNRYSALSDPGSESAVPSWSPDWRVHTEFVSPVPLMASQSASKHIGNFRPLHSQKWKAVYDAPGQRLRDRANVRFHESLKEMWCDGVMLDTIETLGALEGCDTRCRSFVCAQEEPLHSLLQNPQSSYTQKSQFPDPIILLDAIARSLVFNRQDKYLHFVAPDSYISDFLVLCKACLHADASQHALGTFLEPIFLTWFQQNRHLRFDTYTLESLVHTIIVSSSESTLGASLPPPTLHATSAAPLPPPTSIYPPKTTRDTDSDDADTFMSRFLDTIRKKSRRLMATTEGHIGMAPCRARLGDAVVVLFGCSIPLILRRVGTREAWQVIGEAYVHGFMEGEVGGLLRKGRRSTHRFRLV